jgi:hypothetical protein
MADNQKPVSISGVMILLLALVNAIFIKAGYIDSEKWYRGLIISVPLLIWAVVDARRQKTEANNVKIKASYLEEDNPVEAGEDIVAPLDALEPVTK